MAAVQPFRATLFDPARAGDVGAALCPPYDVISQQDQYRLYLRSPRNIIRLELGQDLGGDSREANRYTRAASQLARWLAEGILREDPEPALYAYVQEWEGGTRHSFFATVRLAEWDKGEVIPHEQTLSGPKADRLLLMRHTAANLSPVFGLYDDPTGAVAQVLAEARGREPDLEADQGGGHRHRLWRIRDWDAVAQVQEALSAQPIYIADGHHRYETALTYRDERREGAGAFTGDESWSSVLMCLSDVSDPGLEALPTHRLVKAPDLPAETLLARLAEHFEVAERPAPDSSARIAAVDHLLAEMAAIGQAGGHAFGLAMPGEGRVLLLTLAADPQEALAGTGRGEAWRRLDVAILHYLIIAGILGIPEEDWRGGKRLAYTREHREVLLGLESGEFQAGFFLNGTPVARIREVAAAGDLMPQKSTFFHPKVPTGLVIHRLGEVPVPASAG